MQLSAMQQAVWKFPLLSIHTQHGRIPTFTQHLKMPVQPVQAWKLLTEPCPKKGKIGGTYKFIAVGGDGGTYDIGFQSLSGAMERNTDMVYVCYDNEAYMNTGIQRSSATPLYADTTTTPVGTVSNGKPQNRKDLAEVIAAHHVPYVAQTTFVQNFRDLHIKSEKALYTPGAAFLNIMAPCPRGWRYNTPDIIDLCKAAVDTCFWPLFECYDGEKLVVNYIPKKKLPIEDFLRSQ